MRDPHVPVSGRPALFLFWGVVWLIIYAAVTSLAVFIVRAVLAGHVTLSERPHTGSAFWSWLILLPLGAYLFVVAPWWLLSQAGLGFTLFVQSLDPKYHDVKLQRFVGSARHATIEARIETSATRFWTALGAVGFWPGIVFACSALVIALGGFIAVTIPGRVTREQAIELVRVGAMYRGKKPDYIPGGDPVA